VFTQRLTVFTACALAAAGFALAGCAQTPGAQTGTSTGTAGADYGAAPSAAPLPDGRDALLASVRKMTGTIYRFTGGQSDLTTRGHADPVHKSASLAAQGTKDGVAYTQEFIAIGADYWVRLNMGAKTNQSLGVPAGKWMHVDSKKLGTDADLPFDLAGGGDVLDLAGLLGAVSEAQQTGANEYSGTVDLTVAAGVSSMTDDNLKKLGSKATAMPFTAALDDKGRLVDFIVDGSAVNKKLGARFSFSDFGKPWPINKPRNTVEAPAAVYDLFKTN
jgi:hypothetical protein